MEIMMGRPRSDQQVRYRTLQSPPAPLSNGRNPDVVVNLSTCDGAHLAFLLVNYAPCVSRVSDVRPNPTVDMAHPEDVRIDVEANDRRFHAAACAEFSYAAAQRTSRSDIPKSAAISASDSPDCRCSQTVAVLMPATDGRPNLIRGFIRIGDELSS
jgi:hypothetical protein